MSDLRPYLERIVAELEDLEDGPHWEDCDAYNCPDDECNCPEEVEDGEPNGVKVHDGGLCICSVAHVQRAACEARLALKTLDTSSEERKS